MTDFVEHLNLCREASDFNGGPVERGYDARRTAVGILVIGYKACSVSLHHYSLETSLSV